MGELIVGALICGGLLIWVFSSRRIDRETHRAYGVSVEGLAHQFKAVYESLEREVFDKEMRYAMVVQQVVRRNGGHLPDNYATKLVSGWADVYGDSLCFRIVVVEAIEFCVKDFYRSYGRRISPRYLHKQVNRVIPEGY